MTIDDVLTKILMHELIDARQRQRLEEAGVFVSEEEDQIDLLQLVLDALGLPRDTTTEDPKGFCRDHWVFLFDEIVEKGLEEMQCRRFISQVRKDAAERTNSEIAEGVKCCSFPLKTPV